MGKKKGKQSSPSGGDLLETLGDFTSKENWDKFFTIRGSDDSFEWYGEWNQLRETLLSVLLGESSKAAASSNSSRSLQILVPGCGNSRMSEHLFDAGFHAITNIDFSKVVISDMLRRNIRDRPTMRWRVMDMTDMQFTDEVFDAVIDKGGFDALMEPEIGTKLGNQYLSEVKRVLKSGGKFICLTLAESHVLGLLFSKFRFSWNMTVHAIRQKPSTKPGLQTFVVVAEKEDSAVLHQITSSFDHTSANCNRSQAFGLHEALENENRIRREYYTGSDIIYSLEDLQLGAKGDLMKLVEGRRVKFTLGNGESSFNYKAVLLDAQKQSTPFTYHCGVFIVPKTRAHEWLFSSEEGQWLVVESSKAARLLMVLLASSHTGVNMEDIQKDLSPLVKQLEPGKVDDKAQIPFMMAGDGIKQRNIVHQVTSSLTGPVIVEDVIYENCDDDISRLFPSGELVFRRLIFQRTEGLVQSEALLTRDGTQNDVGDTEEKKTQSSKAKQRGTENQLNESSSQMSVYHGYLASSYHTGIISGFSLISSFLEEVASAGKKARAAVIGLGAGLLPMFLHGCMPFLQIEVVELDGVMLDVAKDYFAFTQDEHLKVHIADGIRFVKEVMNSAAVDKTSVKTGNGSCDADPADSNARSSATHSETGVAAVDILIIDVDSSDSTSGMTCPAAAFVEPSFLRSVKDSLPDQGLFVVNLVSRSPAIKDMVVSRMKAVFDRIFCLQLEEDVNLVLFGLCSESGTKEESIPESALQLERLLTLKHPEISQSIIDAAKKIKCWK